MRFRVLISREKNRKAINFDLWERLLTLISNQQEVKFNWIRGHFGHPENERCDELAIVALNSEHLIDDTGYEENLFNDTGLEFNSSITNPTEKNSFQSRKDNIKIKSEGDLCRKCGSAVILKPSKKKEFKPGQTYYFEYYFLCPKCKTVYFVEEAKKFL